MKTQVTTISSRRPHEPYYFLDSFERSCKRHSITPHFLQEGPWGGLGSKPKHLLRYLLREGSNFDIVCNVDSWDVIFLSSLEEIVRKYSLFDSPIVFNAERNCFPRADLAEQHPDSISPYKYLNSGFLIGTTEAVIEMLREMKAESIPDDHRDSSGKKIEPNDQTEFMLYYLANQTKATLDTHATIAQSLHGSDENEFTWDPHTQRLTSLVTGNQPAVLHGNGSGKKWLKRVIDLAGL